MQGLINKGVSNDEMVGHLEPGITETAFADQYQADAMTAMSSDDPDCYGRKLVFIGGTTQGSTRGHGIRGRILTDFSVEGDMLDSPARTKIIVVLMQCCVPVFNRCQKENMQP